MPWMFDYQSECHCSKTFQWSGIRRCLFDYQSECHCSKTRQRLYKDAFRFDYQSECHCSKTFQWSGIRRCCLTTSQNVTAPKLGQMASNAQQGLTTSQNVTAPKPPFRGDGLPLCLTTSQNVTAPKLNPPASRACSGLTTSQNVTAPKQIGCRDRQGRVWLPVRMSLLQNLVRGLRSVLVVWLPVRMSLLQNSQTTLYFLPPERTMKHRGK